MTAADAGFSSRYPHPLPALPLIPEGNRLAEVVSLASDRFSCFAMLT